MNVSFSTTAIPRTTEQCHTNLYHNRVRSIRIHHPSPPQACLSSNNTWRTKRLACGNGTTPIMCLNNPSSRTSRVAYPVRRFRPSVSSCTWRQVVVQLLHVAKYTTPGGRRGVFSRVARHPSCVSTTHRQGHHELLTFVDSDPMSLSVPGVK